MLFLQKNMHPDQRTRTCDTVGNVIATAPFHLPAKLHLDSNMLALITGTQPYLAFPVLPCNVLLRDAFSNILLHALETQAKELVVALLTFVAEIVCFCERSNRKHWCFLAIASFC